MAAAVGPTLTTCLVLDSLALLQSRQRPLLKPTNCIDDIPGTGSGTAMHCAPYRVPQRTVNSDLKDINGETFKTSRVTDNMSPRYPISAPLEKLGLRADDALPNGATRSADGKKVRDVTQRV